MVTAPAAAEGEGGRLKRAPEPGEAKVPANPYPPSRTKPPLTMPRNPSQETAVQTCEGFQLILAGPGSGKTRVITEKILHLIDNGIPPNQILALTFPTKPHPT